MKCLSPQQHDELVAAIHSMAQALHAAATNEELAFSSAALQHNLERWKTADAAKSKVDAQLATLENSSVDLLYYRCLYHAASLGDVVGAGNVKTRAALIRIDFQTLWKRDPSEWTAVRQLYEKSFQVAFVKVRDGAKFVPEYAMSFRPEVMFGSR